jgi:GTP-binding protein
MRELAGALFQRVAPAPVPEGAGAPAGQAARARDSGDAGGGETGAAGEVLAEHMVYRPVELEGFEVRRTGEHSFAVHGRGVERLAARYDTDNEEAMAHLEGRLRRMGVIGALEAEGFQAGDELEIAGVVFELDTSAPA